MRVSGYAEARAEGRALPEVLAKVEEHERLCANCREECRAQHLGRLKQRPA